MIVILDFGSQYSELIARRVREANVFSQVISHDTPAEKIVSEYNAKGIILSGGPSSSYDVDAPKCDPALFTCGIPILGICYGMQIMVRTLGGEVARSDKHEYGPASLEVDDDAKLFSGVSPKTDIWMSHGDSVESLPDGFVRLGHTANCPFAAIKDESRALYALQFHPEVTHTPEGTTILRNFLYKICGLAGDWTPASVLDEAVKKIREEVGDQKVLCALSGGVDSTVVSALLHRAIGDNLTCMFIDQGFMRKGEAESIEKTFASKFNINLIYVNAADRFFEQVKGVTDPELKRKRIGETFIRVFEEETAKLKADIPYLAQGTLYSDVIESAGVGASKTAVKIKSHHNVGGLPEDMQFKIIEPVRMLFKDEVRKLGLELGVPEEIVHRQPFPGPGLAIRIIGEVTPERVAILQNADQIVLEEVKAAGLYREIWQSFAVLIPIQTVGVMGDQRTYEHTIAVRAVNSIDAMTAQWARLPYELLDKIASRINNEVQGINRVVYDISSKPPATIEWE